MIVIVEPQWLGHHPTYFANVVYQSSQETTVLALCPDPDEARSMVADLGEQKYNIKYQEIGLNLANIPIKRKFAGLLNCELFKAVHRDIKQYSSGKNPDFVFFCCLYHGAYPFWKNLDEDFPYPWKALMIDIDICHYPLKQKLLQYRCTDLTRIYRTQNCQTIFTLEEERLDQIHVPFKSKFTAFPELCNYEVAEPDALQKLLPGLERVTHPLLGVFGHINTVKCLVELVEIAEQIADRKWGILAAGSFSEKSFTESEQKKINNFFEKDTLSWSYFHSIKEPVYNSFVQRSTALFLCYKDFYRSSNNLQKAAYFKKPVIVFEKGCMGMRVKKYGLGVTVNELSAESLSEAIDTVLDPSFKINDGDALVQCNSPEAIREIFFQ